MKKLDIRSLFIGTLFGLVTSIVSSYFLVQFQSSAKEKEIKMQLFLDEKRTFIDACNDYLNLYRDWHELMNYFIYKEKLKNKMAGFYSEFDHKSATNRYTNWKKEFDYSYGKILLLSDNDFGPKTMEVSTILHHTLREIIFSDTLSTVEKENILDETDNYFIGEWIKRAKEEIQLYNKGQRKEKSFDEYIKELK